jgi:hypothetical protein
MFGSKKQDFSPRLRDSFAELANFIPGIIFVAPIVLRHAREYGTRDVWESWRERRTPWQPSDTTQLGTLSVAGEVEMSFEGPDQLIEG